MQPPGARAGGLLHDAAMRHSGAMRSLRSRLVVAWVLSLMAALAVGGVLVQLYRLSSAAQTGLRAAMLEQGCALVADTYAFYVAGWAGPRQPRALEGFGRELQGVVGMALAGRRGVAPPFVSVDGGGMVQLQEALRPLPEVLGNIWIRRRRRRRWQ